MLPQSKLVMTNGVSSKVGKSPKAILDDRQHKGNLKKGKIQIIYSNFLFYLWIWVSIICDAKPMTQNENLEYLGIYENTYPSRALTSMEWVNIHGCGSMGDFHYFHLGGDDFGGMCSIFRLKGFPHIPLPPSGKDSAGTGQPNENQQHKVLLEGRKAQVGKGPYCHIQAQNKN